MLPVADAAGMQLLGAVARHELWLATGDEALREAARAVLDDGGIADPVFAARTLLPGRFEVLGGR